MPRLDPDAMKAVMFERAAAYWVTRIPGSTRAELLEAFASAAAGVVPRPGDCPRMMAVRQRAEIQRRALAMVRTALAAGQTFTAENMPKVQPLPMDPSLLAPSAPMPVTTAPPRSSSPRPAAEAKSGRPAAEAKSGRANWSDPIEGPQSRDMAGKAVGVSGTTAAPLPAPRSTAAPMPTTRKPARLANAWATAAVDPADRLREALARAKAGVA